MAISSSNRSPSPISNRPRTPESGTRKSFSGNPFTKQQPTIVSNRRSFNPVTPANSPAEFTQRNCCKEGLRVCSSSSSYEQKENEKDHHNLKPLLRAKSPVTKHFMAPTISAASKIAAAAAASPRKKILGERNEAVRVSDSISAEKLLCHSEFVEEIGSKTPITLEAALSMAAAAPPLSILTTTPKNNNRSSSSSIPVSAEKKPLLNSMNQLDFSSVVVEEEIEEAKPNESRVMSCSTKIKAAPPLAPLDADPSAPPYDPQTNYLSPRPLFLHYKPNPRIEVLLNKETEFNPVEGGKRLEDSFSSECCSESENTEEEAQDEAISEEEEKEEETTNHENNNNNIVRVKKISNLHLFAARSKIMPLLLVLVIACLTFPVIDSPLYNTSSMYNKDHQTSSKLEAAASVNIVELAKANLVDGRLAYNNFKLWLVKSTVVHVSTTFKPIPIVFEELGPFLAMNLTTTALDKELLVSQILDYGEKETEVEKSLEQPEKDQNFVGFETDDEMVEEMIGNKETEEDQSEFSQTEEAGDEIKEEALVQQHGNMEIEDQSSLLIPEATTEIELEMLEDVQIEEIEESIEEEANTKEFVGTKDIEEQSPLIPQLPEVVEPITSEAAEFHHGEIEPINAELLTPQISESDDTPFHSSEPEYASSISDTETLLESAINDSEKKKFTQTVWGISSVLLILMASTAFVYLRSKKAASTATTTTVEAPVVVVKGLLPSKKVSSNSSSLSSSGGDSQDPYLERLSSQNWASSHVEMTGHSGPLEMSTSYQHSSSCNPRESGRVSEAESQERKPRRNRDSFAASPSQYSSGGLSPSYGSFTTYEKIHNKQHGYGEDEVVTPVRRSSRIRKLVTSP